MRTCPLICSPMTLCKGMMLSGSHDSTPGQWQGTSVTLFLPTSKAAPTQRAGILSQMPHCHPTMGIQPPPAQWHTQAVGTHAGILSSCQALTCSSGAECCQDT